MLPFQQAGFQSGMYGGVATQPQQAVPGTSLPPYLVQGTLTYATILLSLFYFVLCCLYKQADA